MKRLISLSIVLILVLWMVPLRPATNASAAGSYSYTFPGMKFSVSPLGELYQLEAPLGYEHIMVGSILEGYLVAYGSGEGSTLGYAYYEAESNVNSVGSEVVSNTPSSVIIGTVSTIGNIRIDQFFIASKTMNYIGIKMIVKNIGSSPVTNLEVKRASDFDVDTGGSHGWADYDNYFNYLGGLNMPYAYTTTGQSEWSPGDLTHYLGFMSMPKVAAASVYAWDSYQGRATTGGTAPYFGDGMASVQWNLGTLAPGQTSVMYVGYGEGNTYGQMLSNCVLAWAAGLAYSPTFVTLIV